MYNEAIKFHKVALPVLLLLCLLVFLSGCGRVKFSTEPLNPDSHHSVVNIPVQGQCVLVEPGLWVENEGDHIDLYNNNQCDHGPSPFVALCDNTYQQELCAVQNFLFYITGTYGTMVLNIIKL